MKKLLIIGLFLTTITNAQTWHTSFRAGAVKAVNRTSFEPTEFDLTIRKMIGANFGFQFRASQTLSNPLTYSKGSLQGVVDITELLNNNSRFQWLGAIGATYILSPSYDQMLVFEESGSLKPIISTEVIYWFNERLGIGTYLDLVPYVNYNEYVGCDCSKQTIRQHSQLVTAGLQLSINLGNRRNKNRVAETSVNKDYKINESPVIVDRPDNKVTKTIIEKQVYQREKYFIVFKYDRPKDDENIDDILEDYENLLELREDMKNNKSLKIELISSTSSEGSNEYNEKLSQRRLSYLKDFLAQNGISPNRIKETSLGEIKTTLYDELIHYPVNRLVVVNVLK